MLDVRHLFPGSTDSIYLNTASMALGSAESVRALTTAAQQWQRGRFSWQDAESTGEEARTLAARLLGAPASTIALSVGAAGGAGTIAQQLPTPKAPGNVVVPERDFMSNYLPWALLRDRGYELRTIPDVDGRLGMDGFASAVDSRTAVIATPLVQSISGYRIDLDGLKQLAAQHGAWLVLDASQAFGATRFAVDGVAGVYSCSHKWSLGTRGLGYLYVAPDILDGFAPVLPGWKSLSDPTSGFYGPDYELAGSAARLDVSWPWFNVMADVAGLKILDSVGIDAVENHNRQLVEALAEGGCSLAFEPQERSAIVSLELTDIDRVLAEMDRRNVVASLRGGRLRVSLHLYNTLDDVEALLDIVLDRRERAGAP